MLLSFVFFDKGKPDKYDVLNYRPVSILNAFSKIYHKNVKTLGITTTETSINFCFYYFR